MYKIYDFFVKFNYNTSIYVNVILSNKSLATLVSFLSNRKFYKTASKI